MFSINLNKSKRGKSKKVGIRVNNINNISKVVTPETLLKISSRCKGVSVKIFDKSNNLINQFPTITSTAKYSGVDNKTISMIFKTGKSYDNFVYKFDIKYNRVWVYDYNHKLINILDSIKKASEWSKIPSSTMSDYIKSGKLYKNKFYFYKICYQYNPY
jgi:NUMOD1 domain